MEKELNGLLRKLNRLDESLGGNASSSNARKSSLKGGTLKDEFLQLQDTFVDLLQESKQVGS